MRKLSDHDGLARCPELLDKLDGLFEDVLHFIAQRGDFGVGDVEQTVQDRLQQVRLPVPHRFERVLANGKRA